MKRLSFGAPLPGPAGFQRWVQDALQQLEQATLDDVQAVLAEFKISGTITPTRQIDADTATVFDVVNFLSTLIDDVKKGGQKRSYGN